MKKNNNVIIISLFLFISFFMIGLNEVKGEVKRNCLSNKTFSTSNGRSDCQFASTSVTGYSASVKSLGYNRLPYLMAPLDGDGYYLCFYSAYNEKTISQYSFLNQDMVDIAIVYYPKTDEYNFVYADILGGNATDSINYYLGGSFWAKRSKLKSSMFPYSDDDDETDLNYIRTHVPPSSLLSPVDMLKIGSCPTYANSTKSWTDDNGLERICFSTRSGDCSGGAYDTKYELTSYYGHYMGNTNSFMFTGMDINTLIDEYTAKVKLLYDFDHETGVGTSAGKWNPDILENCGATSAATSYLTTRLTTLREDLDKDIATHLSYQCETQQSVTGFVGSDSKCLGANNGGSIANGYLYDETKTKDPYQNLNADGDMQYGYLTGSVIENIHAEAYSNFFQAIEDVQVNWYNQCRPTIQANLDEIAAKEAEEELLEQMRQNALEIANFRDSAYKSGPSAILGCSDFAQTDFYNYLMGLLTIVKVVIPILTLVLIVKDFVTAVAAGDEDGIKKAQKHAITRLIIGVILFLIPVLVNLIIDILKDIGVLGVCKI